jgi:hypothetical protein
VRKPTARDIRLLTLYGITEEEREKIFVFQSGRCAICRGEFKQLGTDHSHHSGLVRGLLCLRCNKGLALFFDNDSVLARAAAYLVHHPALDALGFIPQGRVGRSTRKWKTKREQRERMADVAARLIVLEYEVPRSFRKYDVGYTKHGRRARRRRGGTERARGVPRGRGGAASRRTLGRVCRAQF